MDIIITVSLVLIAGAMLMGKPLQITITHKDASPKQEPVPEAVQKQLDETAENTIQTMDSVIATLNDMMGVSARGDSDN